MLNVPTLGPNVPRRGNAISRGLSHLALRLSGWRIAGDMPNLSKFVIIVAPHTSNWDFFIGVMVMFALELRGTFLGKHTIFRGPLGSLMRWLGGVPVNRSASHDMVAQTIGYFESRPHMVLALSPEGTRKKLPAWRTGFYHVARGARVPIVPVSFDFPKRLVQIYPAFTATDDQTADLAAIRAYFDASMARHPAKY